jgi:hypothetical protein
MDVPQLLDPLLLGPDVMIVVAFEPERSTFVGAQLAGNVLLEHLYDDRECTALGFGDQQVDVLGHDDVSGDAKRVPLSHALKRLLEDVARLRCAEEWFAPVATERNEVQTSRLLKPLETPGHVGTVARLGGLAP